MQMQYLPVFVPKHLDLDMFGARDILLQKNRRISEGPPGFIARLFEQMG